MRSRSSGRKGQRDGLPHRDMASGSDSRTHRGGQDERIASAQSVLGAVCSCAVAHGSSSQPVVHQLSGLVRARSGEFQGVSLSDVNSRGDLRGSAPSPRACSGSSLLRFPPHAVPRWILLVGIALATGAILSTALISRPIHAQLDIQGNTPELVSRLIATDWIRNVLEWGRTALYVWALSRLIAPGPSGRPAT